MAIWLLTLHSGGQFLSSGWVVSVVGLPALRPHPASVDEVTETVAVVLHTMAGTPGLARRPGRTEGSVRRDKTYLRGDEEREMQGK